MRRALGDLWLGARLAVRGGADSRLRAALTAAGVALGVVLLLFAASVPNMIRAHNARLDARVPQWATGSHAQLREYSADTTFHGTAVSVNALQATGPNPPLPPGITRIPAPGEMLVSPALERLLHTPAGADLAHRLDARISGTIADDGLSGPAELLVYRGAMDLGQRGGSLVTGFGASAGRTTQSPLITLLVILMAVALLLPIGVFVATASRFGSEQRNQRLAAMRLLGADRAATARIAAGEALLAALIGVLLGASGFVALLRPVISHVDIAGISVFSQDVQPSPILAALTVVLVPLASIVFALLAMRHVAIEPLGVSRHGRPLRRRLGWRVLTPLIGFLILLPLIGANGRLASTGGEIEVSAGITLVLIGICALLPWSVEAAVVRAGAGPLPWLLATRRLRLDHGTAGRVVGAIGLAVAGAIALQTVFYGAEHYGAETSTANATRGLVQINTVLASAPDPAVLLAGRLRAVPGVRDVVAVGLGPDYLPVTIAPCATITRVMRAATCGPGSSYLVRQFAGGERPGQLIRVPGHSLRIPMNARVVSLRRRYSPEGPYLDMGSVLLTPAAAARFGLRVRQAAAVARISPAATGAQDRIRDAVAGIDPLAGVSDVNSTLPRDQTLDKLRRALIAGAVAVLLVIGGSLLVSVAEQLRERRQVLAVLAAFGTRATTLAWSVLLQTALPVVLGLTLAICLGAVLGAVLMQIARLPIGFDWGAVALMAGAGAAVVAVVTTMTLPILWGQLRPDGLRAE